MDDTTQSFLPMGSSPRFQEHLKRFPTSAYLRKHAPRNVPRFAFEYGDTGAGNDVGVEHNWEAFDNIKVVPRYGVMTRLPPTGVELFGTKYAAPIGIAPMGGPSYIGFGTKGSLTSQGPSWFICMNVGQPCL